VADLRLLANFLFDGFVLRLFIVFIILLILVIIIQVIKIVILIEVRLLRLHGDCFLFDLGQLVALIASRDDLIDEFEQLGVFDLAVQEIKIVLVFYVVEHIDSVSVALLEDRIQSHFMVI
jgi:hypothetical protein